MITLTNLMLGTSCLDLNHRLFCFVFLLDVLETCESFSRAYFLHLYNDTLRMCNKMTKKQLGQLLA